LLYVLSQQTAQDEGAELVVPSADHGQQSGAGQVSCHVIKEKLNLEL